MKKTFTLLFLIFLLIGCSGKHNTEATSVTERVDSIEQPLDYHKLMARWELLYNTDTDRFWDELYTEDCVAEFIVQGWRYQGREVMKALDKETYATYPDFTLEITNMVIEGNQVSVEQKVTLKEGLGFDAISVLTFNQDGQITLDRTWAQMPTEK